MALKPPHAQGIPPGEAGSVQGGGGGGMLGSPIPGLQGELGGWRGGGGNASSSAASPSEVLAGSFAESNLKCVCFKQLLPNPPHRFWGAPLPGKGSRARRPWCRRCRRDAGGLGAGRLDPSLCPGAGGHELPSASTGKQVGVIWPASSLTSPALAPPPAASRPPPHGPRAGAPAAFPGCPPLQAEPRAAPVSSRGAPHCRTPKQPQYRCKQEGTQPWVLDLAQERSGARMGGTDSTPPFHPRAWGQLQQDPHVSPQSNAATPGTDPLSVPSPPLRPPPVRDPRPGTGWSQAASPHQPCPPPPVPRLTQRYTSLFINNIKYTRCFLLFSLNRLL